MCLRPLSMNITPVTFLSKRWRWPTIAVIVGMLFLARLGLWQLDRLEWRRGENEKKLAALNATPLNLNDDLPETDLTTLKNQQVTAQGEYDLAEQFIVKAQTYQGQQGVYLLTPLRITGQETAVLVNRGWIPAGLTENIKQFDQPGPVQVNGRIQLSETLSGGRETEISAANELFRIDVGAIATQLPYPLLPVYILEEPSERNELPYKLEADLTLNEGNHFSYAIQWFSFAVLLGIIFVYYVNKNEGQAADSPIS